MNHKAPAACVTKDAIREPLLGLAALMRLAYSGVDIEPLGQHLLRRATQDPNDAEAMMDLSTTLQLRGQREVALAIQAQALEVQQLYCLPAAGLARVRLLALMGPGDLMANVPLEFLLEGSDVDLNMLYVLPGRPFPASLPEHDVVFVAVSESDENRTLLRQLTAQLSEWPRPVLNAPDRIAWLSRDGACALLQSTPGVIMPKSARVSREVMQQITSGDMSIASILGDGDFPVIVRPVGSHAGQGLHKLDTPAAVLYYLQAMSQREFYVTHFVDYRGRDGLFRKYRIVLIKGRPFVCHMAISEHWMIHYLNAGMTESADKRAEEARFMESFDTDFALRHREALRVINERMGLDYLGIDCGETPDGRLLIFEVDASMVVHAMDPVDMFPYKQPQMRKVFDAFRTMLASAAEHG